MRSLRHLGFALWLALALAVGQQAAVLHSLSHATQKTSEKNDSTPAKAHCDACSQFAGFAGALGTHVGIPPVVIASPPHALLDHDASIRLAQRLAFLSRAPPTVL
jgi:hypothetical protein